jgi:hypothetical protein
MVNLEFQRPGVGNAYAILFLLLLHHDILHVLLYWVVLRRMILMASNILAAGTVSPALRRQLKYDTGGSRRPVLGERLRLFHCTCKEVPFCIVELNSTSNRQSSDSSLRVL